MKVFTLFLASLVAGAHAQAPTTIYRFDSAHAAGVRGTISVQHATPDSSKAAVFAALDFSGVDKKAIAKFDANCKSDADITEYKWYIHVKWGAKTRAASLEQCGKDLTGDHYDPTKACGPASEFAAAPECTGKTPNYACNPTSYAKDSNVCEKGDLSGKFGSLKPDAKGQVKAKWVDDYFPLRSEAKPQWNIVLHAVCGTATPRIACAVGQEVKYPPKKDAKPSTPVIGYVRIDGGAAYYNGTVVYNNGSVINNNGGTIQINGGSVTSQGTVIYTNGTVYECPETVDPSYYDEWFFHFESDYYPFDYDDGDLDGDDEGLWVEGEEFEYEEEEITIEEHEEEGEEVEEHEEEGDDTTEDENKEEDTTEDENKEEDTTEDDNTEDENTEDENTEDDNKEDENTEDENATDGEDKPDEATEDENTDANEEGDANDGAADEPEEGAANEEAADEGNGDQGGDQGNDGGDQGNADNGDGGDAGGEESKKHKVYTFHLRVGHKA